MIPMKVRKAGRLRHPEAGELELEFLNLDLEERQDRSGDHAVHFGFYYFAASHGRQS